MRQNQRKVKSQQSTEIKPRTPGWSHHCSCYNVLYSRKHSREKTFANFTVLWLFMKFFSVKFGGWCPLALDKRAIHEWFFPQKSYFSPIRKSFPFPATRYWATRPRKLPALLIFYMYGTGTWYKMLQSHTCQSLTRTISPSSSGLDHSLNIMSLWHSHD